MSLALKAGAASLKATPTLIRWKWRGLKSARTWMLRTRTPTMKFGRTMNSVRSAASSDVMSHRAHRTPYPVHDEDGASAARSEQLNQTATVPQCPPRIDRLGCRPTGPVGFDAGLVA